MEGCWNYKSLEWCHNERHGISSHQHLHFFDQVFVQVHIKENKATHHWPLWGESTDDWWILLPKSLLPRKMFQIDDVMDNQGNVNGN